MNAQVFQPPPSSFALDGSGLALGTRVVRASREHVLVVAGYSEKQEQEGGVGPGDLAPRLSLLWIHGNASDCGHESAALAYLARTLDAVVVAPEWPGYGPVAGLQPSVEACDAACEAGLRVASAGERQVIIVGRSLGTGPAVRLARRCEEERGLARVRGLVLWSPMTNVAEVASGFVPSLLGGLVAAVVPKRWNVCADVACVHCPLLVIAGAQDTLTPVQMAHKVVACAASTAKTLHVAPNASHNDGWVFEYDVVAQMEAALHVSSEVEDDDHVDDCAAVRGNSAPVAPLLFEPPAAADNVQVAIVGAGPVGLFLAVSLCALGVPPRSICLYEKHPAYQRHHVLRLEGSSLANAPAAVAALIRPLVGVTKTSLLETTLSQAAASYGLAMVRPCFVQSVEEHVPATVRVLVAADGSKSLVRNALLGGETGRETLQYVLDVRLEVHPGIAGGSVEKMSMARQLAALGHVQHVVEESVSRTKTEAGTHPCTLRLLVSKAEYEALRDAGASLREPLQLPANEHLLPPSIRATVRKWLLIRRSHWPDERYSNGRCTSLDLAVYHAVNVAKRDGPRSVFCVGDAAFGVPFFRALNNGLLSATQLALCIVDQLAADAPTSPLEPRVELKATLVNVPAVSGDDVDAQGAQRGFFGLMAQSITASVGVSKHVADLSARGATELAEDMVLATEADPVLRYTRFMTRLIQREISVAKTKRDGLAIVRISNSVRRSMSSWMPSESSLDVDSHCPWE